MLSFRRSAAEFIVAGVALVALTVLSYPLHLNLATIALLLMIVVVALSRIGSFFSSIVGSIIAAACLAYVAAPAFSFRVDDPLDDVAIIAFLFTSLIITRLMSTVREQAKEALSSVSYKVIEAEERERQRIAHELHENIAQRVSLLVIAIEQLKTDSHEGVDMRSRIDATQKQSLGILTDVKALAHELYSPRLELIGIAGVMSGFCRDFGQKHNVEIDFGSDGPADRVLPDLSLCLFRVLQEALHNAVEHSGVSRFAVRLNGTADAIQLTISDCGAGFKLETTTTNRGLGFNRMRERLKLVNGSLSIDSQPKRGTTIRACAPIRLRRDSGRDSVSLDGRQVAQYRVSTH